MSWEEWVYAQGIVFAAFAVRGLTGFGTALVMAPLLTLFLDLKRTAVITSVVAVLNGVGLAFELRKDVARRMLLITSAASLIGLAAGTYLLVTQPGPALKRAVGFITVVFGADMFRQGGRGPSENRPWPEGAGVPVGLLSGVLGGLFGTSGPPMVVFLSRKGLRLAAFRATLIAFFCVLDTARAVGYAATGLITREILIVCAWLMPISYLGSFAGKRIHDRVPERTVRVAVAATLLVTGLVLVMGR